MKVQVIYTEKAGVSKGCFHSDFHIRSLSFFVNSEYKQELRMEPYIGRKIVIPMDNIKTLKVEG